MKAVVAGAGGGALGGRFVVLLLVAGTMLSAYLSTSAFDQKLQRPRDSSECQCLL